MRTLDTIFDRLAGSSFRRRFRLGAKESAYIRAKSLPVVMEHAREFIATRLAPAHPENDGKQTPMRGHPVFIAQHATATCCRSCLAKWHGIEAGRALLDDEQRHVLVVIERWIAAQKLVEPPGEQQPRLL